MGIKPGPKRIAKSTGKPDRRQRDNKQTPGNTSSLNPHIHKKGDWKRTPLYIHCASAVFFTNNKESIGIKVPWIWKSTMYGLANTVLPILREIRALYFQFLDGSFYSADDRCLVVSDGRKCRWKTGSGNESCSVFGLQEPPFVQNRLPAGLDEWVFEKRIEQDNHMTKIVYPNMKALLAGKESFHILDANLWNAKQMISIGTRHNTCHLFLSEVAAERKRRSFYKAIGMTFGRWRQRFRLVIQLSQLHTFLKGEVGCSKKRLDKVGAFGQQSLDDVDVHLVAVSANCTVAVDIPMTVDEVIHIAVIPLAIQNHILKIEFSRF